MKDYTDKILSEGHFLRKFHSNYAGMELDWHRDYDDREIRVVKGRGWKCQLDNQLPVDMNEGQVIRIPARTFHRLFAGSGPLIIEVVEGKKKKKLSKKQMKIAKAAPPEDEITGDDFAALRKKTDELSELEERRKKRRKRRKKKTKTDFDKGTKYPAYRDRPRGEIKKNRDLTIAYKNATTEKQRQRIRDRIDRQREREAKKMKNETKNMLIDPDILREYIEEIVEARKLAIALEEAAEIEEAREEALWEFSEHDTLEELEEKRKRKRRKKRKKSGSRTLSKAVKKSLDKKADRRCLTRGSVYAEFRAGLGAYYSSGSRRGMSAHQWAHARVNSANPSKSWAKVKKRKKCPKKKKK